MFQTIRTHLVLAAAALALVATSAAPIATTLAAPLAPSQESVMTKAPDLDVHFQKRSYGDESGLHLYVEINNIGNLKSGMVPVKVECVNEEHNMYPAYVVVGRPLNAGEGVVFSTSCDSHGGAKVTVGTPGDTNTSNNVAYFNDAASWD